MLHDALDLCTDGPATIRWSKTAAPSVPDHEVGSGLHARKVREGRDVCILAVGKMLGAAQDAAERLAADGIDATVWDVRVVPLDPEMLADAARHAAVLTAEDGVRDGGVGAMIADALAHTPLLVLSSREDHDQTAQEGALPAIRVLGVPVAFIPHGKPDQILADLGLDGAGLATEARALLSTLEP